MKNYICPGCGNSDLGKTKFFYDGKQKLLKCKNCKLIFRIRIASLNEEINYSSNCINENYKKNLLNNINARKNYKIHILNIVKRHIQTPKSFLDIGSSIGTFLNVASEIFPETKLIGIEPSKAEVNIGESMFKNIKFINSYYKKELFDSESFDIIHHSHVIEHIISLKEFLENNYYHLKRGGILLISYPSVRSLLFFIDFITKRYPGHILQEQHFNYFSPKSIINTMKNSGFKLIEAIYGVNYLKRNKKILKFTIDPFFKLFKIGSPYLIFTKK